MTYNQPDDLTGADGPELHPSDPSHPDYVPVQSGQLSEDARTAIAAAAGELAPAAPEPEPEPDPFPEAQWAVLTADVRWNNPANMTPAAYAERVVQGQLGAGDYGNATAERLRARIAERVTTGSPL